MSSDERRTRRRPRGASVRRGAPTLACLLLPILPLACRADVVPQRAAEVRPGTPIPDSAFARLVERLSEPSGYFDTDNLISNEGSYLKVMGALDRLGTRGAAYVGVGPDQNFSYIARVKPRVAFMVDVRRDNLLHHLLLKALVERAPTRVEFLAGLHGRAPPSAPGAWRDADVEEIVDYVDSAATDAALVTALDLEVADAVGRYGVSLSAEDLETIRRFHQEFVEAGPGLRFTSFGRAPRPYYPTYGQLLLETDLEGRAASYLATPEAYQVVRELQLANKVIPVVGDLAGVHAVREIGAVMREMGVELTAFYASNVEFYLWRSGTFERWRANLASVPAADDAVVIRSYFPNFGARHPSAVAGYYSTQSLQPVRVLLEGDFRSYWESVTQGIVELGAPAGVR